jgi:hypothetical protein
MADPPGREAPMRARMRVQRLDVNPDKICKKYEGTCDAATPFAPGTRYSSARVSTSFSIVQPLKA